MIQLISQFYLLVFEELFQCPSVNQDTMKALSIVSLLSLSVLASMLFTGCSSVPVPPAAKGYSVICGNTAFWAKSVKIHGSWAELETDAGPILVSGAAITPKN
jgi:hypothetical protein